MKLNGVERMKGHCGSLEDRAGNMAKEEEIKVLDLV